VYGNVGGDHVTIAWLWNHAIGPPTGSSSNDFDPPIRAEV
jgi:hypothetical protein